MDDLKMEQLARARELAKVAKERIKQMTPDERAEYEGKRQADAQRRAQRKAAIERRKAEGAKNPYKETTNEESPLSPPPAEQKADEPEAPDPPPPTEPLAPAVADPATPAPRRKRVRRIIVESSDSASSSGEDEIIMRRAGRRKTLPKPRKEELTSVHDDRQQSGYDHIAHFYQMRSLGLI